MCTDRGKKHLKLRFSLTSKQVAQLDGQLGVSSFVLQIKRAGICEFANLFLSWKN